MSSKSIHKLSHQIPTPDEYECLPPVQFHKAHNPPPSLSQCPMHSAPLVFVSLSPPIGQYMLGLGLSSSQLVPNSANEREVKVAGLFQHGFKVKALLEEGLLIMGSHSKIHPDNMPSNPSNSSCTRYTLATPSEAPSKNRPMSGTLALETPVIKLSSEPKGPPPVSNGIPSPPAFDPSPMGTSSSSHKRAHLEESPTESIPSG
ncbi:hypothetical protein Salat_1665600 [Sesamum alatum]|uniref:Uncharacterized protein n=1 Tax=Sesamum alatum TaxID=300844 RepID=A0AAE1Y6R0_9LAMI|nr:hypothetical protein Salat_1665600 [Sesamum alatum]